MKLSIAILTASLTAAAWCAAKPNILFITVDDMSCDSVGVFGCNLEGTTPNMDRLAGQGLRFQHAHVVVGNCKPSRNVMFSGRFPHNNKVEGFYSVKNDYPVLADLFKAGGYFTAIRGKVTHSTPYHPYAWDLDLTKVPGDRTHIKNAASYGRSMTTAVKRAKEAGKPFCVNVNISDPHKPFYKPNGDPNPPSRVYTAKEVPVPGFLPDHPAVRRELALYYSSVRRADDCLGAVLKALDESGQADNTVVMFLSDHGMPLPFAKTAVWHHSTWTPWMVRWPGVVKKGTVDTRHMVSAIDLLPTLLDIAGIAHPDGLEGRSLLPLLKGEKQERAFIIKEYNEAAGGDRSPKRCVQTKKYGYIFNPWSDGKRIWKTATMGTASYRTMKELAKTDEKAAARLKLFNHRVLEEFYDVENDPDMLHNLIDAPEHREALVRHRKLLEQWMEKSRDPLLEVFRKRDRQEVLDAYMTRVQRESAERRKGGRKKKDRKQNPHKANAI